MPEPDAPPGAPPPVATWRQRLELLAGAPPSPGPARVALTVAGAAVAVVVLVLALRGPPAPAELSLPLAGGPGDPAPASSTTTTVATELLVHAAGAVQSPGLYRLAAGARVADLVEAAGGPVDDSDIDRLNLATPLTDGQRVYVPRLGEVAEPGPVAPGATDAGGPGTDGSPAAGLVDVNTATAEQLDTLPGVGPATAAAILEERERRGRFGSVDDLLDVRGIGEAKLEALRDLVRVGPAAG